MTRKTKICVVKTCEYSNGTRENVKMFKTPKDEERILLWKQALNMEENEILKGMVCIHHFSKNDITTGNNLKKVAIPSIEVPIILTETFREDAADIADDGHDEDNIDNMFDATAPTAPGTVSMPSIPEKRNEPDQTDQPDPDDIDCEKCNVLKAEVNSLKEDYHQMKCEYESKINKIERDLSNATTKLNAHKNEMRNLKKKLEYAKSSKERLSKTLKDLQKEKLLSQEILDMVEVMRMEKLRYYNFNKLIIHSFYVILFLYNRV